MRRGGISYRALRISSFFKDFSLGEGFEGSLGGASVSRKWGAFSSLKRRKVPRAACLKLLSISLYL